MPFGEKVTLDFKLGADQEESVMFESLMNSMDPDKIDSMNELDFSRPRDGKEERESMMINQKTGAFANERVPVAMAGVGVGAGVAVMNQAQPAPQALSYA